MGNNEMNLVAKPIIKNQYWVVTDSDDNKVGNVESQGTGFDVKIGNNIEHYDSTKQIEKFKQIEFEKFRKPKDTVAVTFSTYSTGKNKVYNSVFDVKRKLHLFTKEQKSKCYHAAGWFAVQQGNEFINIFCPKYIFVCRYKYIGPFNTEDELNSSINT